MSHLIIELSEYTKKTGRRYKAEGEYSGEWFLEDIMWPKIKNCCLNCHCELEFNFNGVEITPQFIDEAFTKLITKYRFTQFGEYIILTCDDKNIIYDILAAVCGAEYKTFGQILTKVS